MCDLKVYSPKKGIRPKYALRLDPIVAGGLSITPKYASHTNRSGPMEALGGWRFLMSDVFLYGPFQILGRFEINPGTGNRELLGCFWISVGCILLLLSQVNLEWCDKFKLSNLLLPRKIDTIKAYNYCQLRQLPWPWNNAHRDGSRT